MTDPAAVERPDGAARVPSGHGPDSAASRRALLRGAATAGVALPLLAACGASGGAHSSGGPGSSGSGGSGSGGSGHPAVAAADVPVGGGTILKSAQVVVTQPAQGQFKAFSAICTHQGCLVGTVRGGAIICPCHGSHFSIRTGEPLSGPAPSPLPERTVSVKSGQVEVG